MSHSLTHAGVTTLRSASHFRRFGFGYVTDGLFLLSLLGHWWLGWRAFLSDQASHHAMGHLSEYLVIAGRDTLENWQSEFLQLLWQVGGLAYLLYVGSPQSREGSERLERKIDALLRAVDRNGERTIAGIDDIYDRAD